MNTVEPTYLRTTVRRLAQPYVLLRIAGIGLGLVVLIWPQRSAVVLGRLVGVAIALAAVEGAIGAMKRRPRPAAELALLAAMAAIGVGLVVTPARSEEVVGRIAGVACLLAAVPPILAAVFGRGHRDRSWLVARSGALVSTGILLVGFPSTLLTVVVIVGAVAWILAGAVAIGAALDPASDAGGVDGGRTAALDWLRTYHQRAGAEPDVGEKLLFGPPFDRPHVARFVRFLVLMVLASGISSMGVIADSTAVVIGAMLVAPLMTPLMGMAFSLVVGSPRPLATSAGVAAVGVLVAIGMGVLLGLVEPAAIDVATNSQITSRSEPTIVDLLSAVFAGAAGAYGLSRTAVSDSLPGVAIAISLVPPLTVTGIAWSQGAWHDGNGSLLLFLTNLVAILIVGGATFAVVGAAPLASAATRRARVRTWMATTWGLACLVIAALLLNGAEIAGDSWRDREIHEVVDEWLADSPEHHVEDVGIDGDVLEVVIAGPPGADLDPDELAASASTALDREVTASVRILIEEHLESTSG